MTFFKNRGFGQTRPAATQTPPATPPAVPQTPPAIGLEKTEARLQADCCQWFWNTYPNERQMLFHVNNKARNAIEGNKFKAMGVVKGVSDLVLILSHGRVLWIELKTDTGTQQPAQKEFEAKVKERGHAYLIIRSLEEFKALVAPILPKPLLPWN